jgi:hypothetical protein
MKVRLIKPQRGPKRAVYPIGTVIDHADAYRLVLNGAAEPADAACHAKVAELARQRRPTLRPEPVITLPPTS